MARVLLIQIPHLKITPHRQIILNQRQRRRRLPDATPAKHHDAYRKIASRRRHNSVPTH